MSVNRIQRLNTLLQRELGELFEVFVNPALPGTLVTVTGVEVASTLRSANVFVSIYGPKGTANVGKALEVIERKRAMIQGELSRRVIMKYTPVLYFRVDDTAERADRVERILQELNLPDEEKEGDSHGPEDA